MFEAFAIDILQVCSNVENARKLLRMDWAAADQIMKRAVALGVGVRSIPCEQAFERSRVESPQQGKQGADAIRR